MSDRTPFLPRVEEPPPRMAGTKHGKNDAVRAFVRAAAGKWCLVAESAGPRQEQNRARASAQATFAQGASYAGRSYAGQFEVQSHVVDGVTRVYARYVGPKSEAGTLRVVEQLPDEAKGA